MEQTAENRRDTFRMPQPDVNRCAMLKIGRRSFPCHIIDQSAGGFLIGGPAFPSTVPTRPVELITTAGRHPSRVVWRRLEDGEVRIGLERLPEDLLLQRDSSWMIWLTVAIVLGFGGGYLFANRNQPLDSLPVVQRWLLSSEVGFRSGDGAEQTDAGALPGVDDSTPSEE